MHNERPLTQEENTLSEDSTQQISSTEATQLPAVLASFSTLNELIDNQALQYGNYPAVGMALEDQYWFAAGQIPHAYGFICRG